MKQWRLISPVVQGKNKEEAKRNLEARLKALLLHPDDITDKEIEEVHE